MIYTWCPVFHFHKGKEFGVTDLVNTGELGIKMWARILKERLMLDFIKYKMVFSRA